MLVFQFTNPPKDFENSYMVLGINYEQIGQEKQHILIGFYTSEHAPLQQLFLALRIRVASLQMGGVKGITERESTQLTLQTKGTRGIRMHLIPRDQCQPGTDNLPEQDCRA